MADLLGRLKAALALPGSDTSDYDLNPGVALPPGRVLRPAAVLIAVTEGPAGLSVILTKRSSRLRHHPGQIACPGGQVDRSDADETAAALREADEEVGLAIGAVEVLGTMQPHETVTGFRVTPVFGRVTRPFTPVPETGEVEEVFTVPLAHVANPLRYGVEARLWRGQLRYYYVVPYGPYYIWGATARILKAMADRMAG